MGVGDSVHRNGHGSVISRPHQLIERVTRDTSFVRHFLVDVVTLVETLTPAGVLLQANPSSKTITFVEMVRENVGKFENQMMWLIFLSTCRSPQGPPGGI